MPATSLRHLPFTSKLLANNRMGNRPERIVSVLFPYSFSEGETYPTFWFLDGYLGNGLTMLADPGPLGTSFYAQLHQYQKEGTMPRAFCVFPDASTKLGGSQYINSLACGPFMNHFIDELVPFVDSHFPTLAVPAARVLAGHSSGGYGALMTALLRPGVFGSVIASAADSAFDLSLRPHLPTAAMSLRKAGGIAPFLKQFFSQAKPERCSYPDFLTLMILAMASCYSPTPSQSGTERSGTENLFDLPFDIDSMNLIPDVWARWLEWDPVHLLRTHAPVLKALNHLQLDVGSEDEYCAQYGHRAMAKVLEENDIAHTYSEFSGGHSGTSGRYAQRFKELTPVLQKLGIF